MKVRRLLFVAVFVLSLLTAIVVFWQNFLHTPLTIHQPVIFNIAPGSHVEKVAADLQRQGYTRYPMLMILLARLQGSDKHLKVGEYQLQPGTTPEQFFTKVVKGQVYLRHFTLVEGWTLRQVVQSMNKNPFLKHTVTSDDLASLASKMGIFDSNFEGMLNPDTYKFARGVADTVILKKAYRNMQENLGRLWESRDPSLPFNRPYEALIVASLIEKETAQPQERAMIAGVIVRRLQQHMRLQIDASVIYGLGTTYQGRLTHDDMKIDTAYNTYLHEGLPPTPIAMPSLPSVVAALHPAAGNALYYVARGDGSHEFTATLDEHIAAIKKYRGTTFLTTEEQSSTNTALDNSFVSDPLFPKNTWDEQVSKINLLGEQKTIPQQTNVKHNNPVAKTQLAKKKPSRLNKARNERSHTNEVNHPKGHLHHH